LPASAEAPAGSLRRSRRQWGVDVDSPASETALRAARHRAAHQLLEGGAIYADPLAVRVLGESEESLRRYDGDRRMRWFVCARAWYADQALADAVDRGVDQLVVLGAGLDTYAYRNPYPALRVVEVDHPATQAWKLGRLGEAGIDVPASVTHVPVDFERDDLGQVLHSALDGSRPVLFWWLGVTPYLTVEAIGATLRVLGSLSSAAVVLDHAVPARSESAAGREHTEPRRRAVAALGEPWISCFDGAELAALLHGSGFEDVRRDEAAPIIRARLGLPPSPGDGQTRLALATTGWPQAARS
jgi:methyltransferase (TIGR00027 family)